MARERKTPPSGSPGGRATRPRRRRRRHLTYAIVWRRSVSASGLVIAVAEIVESQLTMRPVDQNVLLFAAGLIGLPVVAGRGGRDE